jgi:hypothetical protein
VFGAPFSMTALRLVPLNAQYIEPASDAERLMYSTVHVIGKNAEGKDVGGTGFFYQVSLQDNKSTTLLITNKHVVRDAGTSASITVHTRLKNEGAPDGTANIKLDIAEWVNHPNSDIDLCAYPIQPLFNQLKPSPFYLGLTKNLVPSQEMLNDLDAIEDVVMIGYPVLLYDTKNEYPIIRRGVTASHPATNFNGKPQTALDIAVFPGSSGSPVLIYNTGSVYDKRKNTRIFGPIRVLFLGILYQGASINTQGNIQITEAPTIIHPSPTVITGSWQIAEMMNVGYIIKSAETEPLVTTVLQKFGVKEL